MSKQEFAKRQSRKQRKVQKKISDDRENFTRFKCNWLKFWLVCQKPPCRRHKACSGDAQACWDLHWSALPEDFKNHLRLAIGFARSMPWEAAVEAAVAKMARHTAAAADLAARLATPATAARVHADPPRVRRL